MFNILKARKVIIDSSNSKYFTIIIETDNPSFAFISKCLLTIYKLEGLCSQVSREDENVSIEFLLSNPLKLYRCLRSNGCLVRISKEDSVKQVISELKPEMDREIAESKQNQIPKDTGERATVDQVHKMIEQFKDKPILNKYVNWYEKSLAQSD